MDALLESSSNEKKMNQNKRKVAKNAKNIVETNEKMQEMMDKSLRKKPGKERRRKMKNCNSRK